MKYDRAKMYDYENGYILTSGVQRLGKVLAHYELYKKIVDLPGDVIELGVFKGNSFMQFCTFRELLENERSRKIVGFDMFGAFPHMGGGDCQRRSVRQSVERAIQRRIYVRRRNCRVSE